MVSTCFCMGRILKLITILLIALSFVTSCARMPSAKRSQSVIKHYFKKYAKKYPDSIYGKSPIKDIEITKQSEIHKHLVSAESFVTFTDGTVERIYTTLEMGPVGWRFISWENATGL